MEVASALRQRQRHCLRLQSAKSGTNRHDKSLTAANVTSSARHSSAPTAAACDMQTNNHKQNHHLHLHHHHNKQQQPGKMKATCARHHEARHCRATGDNNCARHANDHERTRDNYSQHKSAARPLSSLARVELKRRGRVISPALLLLLAMVLAHLCCHLTIITGSLAAPAASSEQFNSSRVHSAPMRVDQSSLPLTSGDGGGESWRAKPESMRDLRDARLGDKLNMNMSTVFEVIFKKRPYSRYWTAEQKWDDLFTRLLAVQGTVRHMMMKNFLRDIEYYADLAISAPCQRDLKFIQNYSKQSNNFRWLAHMLDAAGKSEPGMLTGMLAHMGHPVQCIRVRAPATYSNETFDERFFEEQTSKLGERFRGKYCLASMRPVLPEKPHLISRFSQLLNDSLLSNISYTGESMQALKRRAHQTFVPLRDLRNIDRNRLRLDQVPFESELYEYLINQRNFMYTLPRFMGVCYPSSCTRDDIRQSLQKTLDDQHQVVDIEFECEQEELNAWDWFITPRLIAYVLLGLISGLVFLVSLVRYVLLSKMNIKRSKLPPQSKMANFLDALDMFSMDKCAGILFIKTKPASPIVDWSRVENNRSTSIDALRGFLILVLVYSQMAMLGCLPVPFMWSKWSDAMFPFFRSMLTQVFINMWLWSEAFYMIGAYLIALKCFENFKPTISLQENLDNRSSDSRVKRMLLPDVFAFTIKRYIRLAMPMLAFILLNYIWPRLSNGFVFQDQANKLMKPCDTFGWTNMLLFHNHNPVNETCLWPSHVSAAHLQLHLISYPLLVLCLTSLWVQFSDQYDNEGKLMRRRKLLAKTLTWLSFGLMAALGLMAAIYSAWQASEEQLIVPFLIDYLDFDNYRRVIEWMVMPTYNHVTSYLLGIALAFVVIRRKASNERRRLEAAAWFSGQTAAAAAAANATGHYAEREGSLSSARSSSTQELQDGLTFRAPMGQGRFHLGSGPPSVCASSQLEDHDDEETFDTDASLSRINGGGSSMWRFLSNCLASIVLLASLLASWLWNGLGQPMSTTETFWYVLGSKLCFCLAFAYLFHQHCATKRNSSNPWMVTRFLVPIGRMSLTVFYVSWLVIWFDLLASLHQWHPSHYFLFEKYNEVIFITLIVSMFVYGAFEGIIKRIQYAARLERVKLDQKAASAESQQLDSNNKTIGESRQLRHPALAGLPNNKVRVKPFESFFDAPDKAELAKGGDGDDLGHKQKQLAASSMQANAALEQQQQRQVQTTNTVDQQARQSQAASGDKKAHQLSATYGNLSPSDRYKLNAELRANYSFASIGLYENAGATSDLSNLNAAAHDPQPSPAMSTKR